MVFHWMLSFQDMIAYRIGILRMNDPEIRGKTQNPVLFRRGAGAFTLFFAISSGIVDLPG
jgi:hypothetical protein